MATDTKIYSRLVESDLGEYHKQYQSMLAGFQCKRVAHEMADVLRSRAFEYRKRDGTKGKRLSEKQQKKVVETIARFLEECVFFLDVNVETRAPVLARFKWSGGSVDEAESSKQEDITSALTDILDVERMLQISRSIDRTSQYLCDPVMEAHTKPLEITGGVQLPVEQMSLGENLHGVFNELMQKGTMPLDELINKISGAENETEAK